MTLFSIIIPCYNQAHFLTDCVNSVLAQDFGDWEIIIVNDGSTDNTLIVALDFAQKDQRINVIDKENGGLSSARNAGLKAVNGEWIQFVDSDDFLLEGCLHSVSNVVSKADPLDIIHTGFKLVDKFGQPIWKKILSESYSPLWEIVKSGGIGPPLSLVINRKLVNEIGDFDTELKSAEDWDFWLRAGKLGAMRKTISSPLVAYRYLDNSMSRSPWRMYQNTEKVAHRITSDDPRILGKLAVDIHLPFDEVALIHKRNILQITGLAIMQSNISEAKEFFEKESTKYGIEYDPIDFALMNSFLTFRYHYSKAQIDLVLNVFRPLFIEFFKKSNYSASFSKRAIAHIFERHIKNRNLNRYGKFGRLLNYLLDRKKLKK